MRERLIGLRCDCSHARKCAQRDRNHCAAALWGVLVAAIGAVLEAGLC